MRKRERGVRRRRRNRRLKLKAMRAQVRKTKLAVRLQYWLRGGGWSEPRVPGGKAALTRGQERARVEAAKLKRERRRLRRLGVVVAPAWMGGRAHAFLQQRDGTLAPLGIVEDFRAFLGTQMKRVLGREAE